MPGVCVGLGGVSLVLKLFGLEFVDIQGRDLGPNLIYQTQEICITLNLKE